MKKSKAILLILALIVALSCVFAFTINAEEANVTVTIYGANGEAKSTSVVADGTEITLPSTGYTTIEGGTFFGWFTDDGAVYAPGATVTVKGDALGRTSFREAYGSEKSEAWGEGAFVGTNEWTYIRLTGDISAQSLSSRDSACVVIDLNGHSISLTKGSYMGRAGFVFVGEGTITITNETSQAFDIQKHPWGGNDHIRFWVGKDVTIVSSAPLVRGQNNFSAKGDSGSSPMENAPEIRIYGNVTAPALFRSNGTARHVTRIYGTASVTVTGANAIVNDNNTDSAMGIRIEDGATFNITDSFVGFYNKGDENINIEMGNGVKSNYALDVPDYTRMEFVPIDPDRDPETDNSFYASVPVPPSTCGMHTYALTTSTDCSRARYKCLGCNTVYTDITVASEEEHDWEIVAEYPATCLKGAMVDRVCTVCGYKQVYETVSDIMGHTYDFEHYTEDAEHIHFICLNGCGIPKDGDKIQGGNIWNGYSNVYAKVTLRLSDGEHTGYVLWGNNNGDQVMFDVQHWDGRVNNLTQSYVLRGETINPRQVLLELTIPEGVTAFNPNTFSGVTGLREVTLPSTLTETASMSMRMTCSYRLGSCFVPSGYTGVSNDNKLSTSFLGDASTQSDIINKNVVLPTGITQLDTTWLGTSPKTFIFLGEMTKILANGYWKNVNGYAHEFAFSFPNMKIADIKGTFVPTTAVASNGLITVDTANVVKDQTSTGTLVVDYGAHGFDSAYANANYMRFLFCSDEAVVYLVGQNQFTILKNVDGTLCTCTGVEGDTFVYTAVPSVSITSDEFVLFNTHTCVANENGDCFCGANVGHNWEFVKYADEGNCITYKKALEECTNCSSRREIESNVYGDHEWITEEVLIENTCHTSGSERQRCVYCNDTQVVETLPDPLKHVWDTVVTAEATCTAPGSKHKTCTVEGCGREEDEVIPALGHLWVDQGVVREATCQDFAYMGLKCSRCNEEELTPFGDKGEHDWQDTGVTTSADCLHIPTKEQECSVCHTTQTVETGELGDHTWGEWETIPATCIAFEQKTRTCGVCEETETETVGSEYGSHDWQDTGVTTPGDCTTAPTKEQECSVCHETQTVQTGDPLGHSWGDPVVTPATCIAYESVTRTCTACGEVDVQETTGTEYAPHDWQEITVDGTCVEAGYTYNKCRVCGIETEHISTGEVSGHKFVYQEFYGDYTFKNVLYHDIKQVGTSCTVCGATQGGTQSLVLELIREDGGNRTAMNGDEVYVRFTFLFNGEEVTEYLPYFDVFTVNGYNKMLNGIVTEFTYKGEVINLREATVKVALPEGTTELYLKGGEGFIANMPNFKEMGLPRTFQGLSDYGAMGKLGDFRFESNYFPRDFASISQGETFGSTNLLNEDLIFPVGFTSSGNFYIGHNTNRVVFLGEMTKLEAGKFYRESTTNGNKDVKVYFANANMSVSDIKGEFYPLTSIAADGTLTIDSTSLILDQTSTGSFDLIGEHDSKSKNATEVRYIFCADDTIVYRFGGSSNQFTYIKYDETTDKYITVGGAEVTIDPSFDLSELAIHTHEKDGKCFCGEEVEVEEEAPELSAMVTFVGYSVSPDGKSVVATYDVNRTLFNDYIRITGKKPDIGFLLINVQGIEDGTKLINADQTVDPEWNIKFVRQDTCYNDVVPRLNLRANNVDILEGKTPFIFTSYVSNGTDLYFVQGAETTMGETGMTVLAPRGETWVECTVKYILIGPDAQSE